MITIWHNPRCSKSRQALALIEAAEAPLTIRRYLEEAPSVAEIEAARDALGFASVQGMIRVGEKLYKELGLGKEDSEPALIAAMAAHPILIERPIIFAGNRACIGRPPEAVRALL